MNPDQEKYADIKEQSVSSGRSSKSEKEVNRFKNNCQLRVRPVTIRKMNEMHVLFYFGAFCLKQKGQIKENKRYKNNEMIKKKG